MAEICIVYDFECCLDPVVAFEPEIGKNLCRVKIDTHSTWDILKGRGKYRGYRKEILTENLTERDKTVLICTVCEGIMKEACISSSGEQLCSCCGLRSSCYRCSPNLSVRKMINSLKCSCPLIGRGCEWLGSLESCENHLDTCGYVHEKCELECGVVLRREELRIHEKEKCPNRIVKCEHCMKDFKSCELNGHLKKCPKMKVSCDLECGAAMCREDMEQHLKRDCGMVRSQCNLGCGVELTRNKLRVHVKDTCPHRIVKCEHCMKDFKSCEMNGHFEKCPMMKVSCDLKCGAAMCREDIEQHLYHHCGMVQDTCNLGCGVELTRDELKLHEKDTCVQRIMKCEHCFAYIRYWNNPKHLKECPRVRVACELCSVEIYREDMTEHIEKYCPEEMVECPFVKYKCLTRIKRKDMGKHLEEKETKHLGLKLAAMEDLISKQNEEINKLHEKIEKLNKENKKQDKEMKTEITSTSQLLELLYYLYDTTEIIWRIDNVTNPMKYLRTMSVLYDVAGYRFSFEFGFNGELHIVFPETTSKYDRPFIAKCHIVFSSRYRIHCGVIEVKQKELMRGCDRIFTTISKEDVYKYSKPRSPGDTKRGLTLRIFLTMQ